MAPSSLPPALYVHGWGVGPDGVKAKLMREYLAGAFEVHSFDCHAGGYAHTNTSRVLSRLEAFLEERGGAAKWSLVGSSHGAYLAALVASRRPDLIQRLLLLAPAFDPLGTWVGALCAAHPSWGKGATPADDVCDDGFNQTGDGSGGLRWEFVADLRQHPPFPYVRSCPVVLVHGLEDAEVEPRVTMEWVRINAAAVVGAHFLRGTSADAPMDHGLYHFAKPGATSVPTFVGLLREHWGAQPAAHQ